jgi:hypothetical protein
MSEQTHLQKHIPEKTLLDVAEDTVRLTDVESEHLDRCRECFAHMRNPSFTLRERAP